MQDWFKIVVDNNRIHPKFKHLIDFGYMSEKELLEIWIKRFIVRDGELKTIKEFQMNFHSTMWEIYLNEAIVTSGGKIDESIYSPDFFIENNGKKASIEAVVANIGLNGIPESARTTQDVYGVNDSYKIIDESIIRLINSITYKSKKYNDKYKNNISISNNPYVIAISDHAQINSGQTSYFSLLAVLYSAYYDPDDKMDLKILGYDNLNREYKYKEKYYKDNGSEVDLGIFLMNDFKHISAIIYTCTLTLGKLTSLCRKHSQQKFIIIEREDLRKIRYSGSSPDEYLLDGLFIFHNPNAEKPFSSDFFKNKGVTHIYFDEDDCDETIKIKTQGSHSSLIRRFVGPKGYENIYINDMEDFIFSPANKVDFFGI